MDKPLLLLLVDDDLDDQMLFQDAIKEIDPLMQVITAVNGVDALKILSSDPISPDYIFVDLNMPLMNGIQCLQEIKKIRAHANVPVIIYSTSSYERDILQTINNGAFYYIVKPFSFQELCEKLKKVLSMKVEVGGQA